MPKCKLCGTEMEKKYFQDSIQAKSWGTKYVYVCPAPKSNPKCGAHSQWYNPATGEQNSVVSAGYGFTFK